MSSSLISVGESAGAVEQTLGRAGRRSRRSRRVVGRSCRRRCAGPASVAAGSQCGSSSCRCQRSRLIMRVRSPTRSSRWSTSRRTSRSGPSSRAVGRSGSRSTARATASASIGSDLPNVRARVADVGHQLRRHPGDPLTGGEQVALEAARQVPAVLDRPAVGPRRTGQPSAAAPGDLRSRCPACGWPAGDRCSSTATTVWVRLCASMPRMTKAGSPSFERGARIGRRAFPSRGAMPRSSQATPADPEGPEGRTTYSGHYGQRSGGANLPDPSSLSLGTSV